MANKKISRDELYGDSDDGKNENEAINSNIVIYNKEEAMQALDYMIYGQIRILQHQHVRLQNLYFTSQQTIEEFEQEYIDNVSTAVELLNGLQTIKSNLKYDRDE